MSNKQENYREKSDVPQITSIVTHDGMFHADEVFAVTLARMIRPNANLIRTRDEEALRQYKSDKNVLVLDVGREYNREMGNVDHHQANIFKNKEGQDIYNGEVNERGIRLATIGLLWRHVGEYVTRTKFQEFLTTAEVSALFETIEGSIDDCLNQKTKAIVDAVQKTLFDTIDAKDNGQLEKAIGVMNTNVEPFPTKETNVLIMNDLVRFYNPRWPQGEKKEDYDKQFEVASAFAGAQIDNTLNQAMVSQFGSFLLENIDIESCAPKHSPTIRILNQFIPGLDAKISQVDADVLYLILSPGTGGENWVIKFVGQQGKPRFSGGVPLELRVSPEKLEEVHGIRDISSVANTGHLVFAKTKDAALRFIEEMEKFKAPK